MLTSEGNSESQSPMVFAKRCLLGTFAIDVTFAIVKDKSSPDWSVL